MMVKYIEVICPPRDLEPMVRGNEQDNPMGAGRKYYLIFTLFLGKKIKRSDISDV